MPFAVCRKGTIKNNRGGGICEGCRYCWQSPKGQDTEILVGQVLSGACARGTDTEVFRLNEYFDLFVFLSPGWGEYLPFG